MSRSIAHLSVIRPAKPLPPPIELLPRKRSSGFLTKIDLTNSIRIGDTVSTVDLPKRKGEVKHVDIRSNLCWILFEDNPTTQSPMYRDKVRKTV